MSLHSIISSNVCCLYFADNLDGTTVILEGHVTKLVAETCTALTVQVSSFNFAFVGSGNDAFEVSCSPQL